LSSRILS